MVLMMLCGAASGAGLKALEMEAVIKSQQLGVYEPPALPTSATGLVAAVKRAAWRWRCVAQVSTEGRSTLPACKMSTSLRRLHCCLVCNLQCICVCYPRPPLVVALKPADHVETGRAVHVLSTWALHGTKHSSGKVGVWGGMWQGRRDT
jgi:hypothetical protein